MELIAKKPHPSAGSIFSFILKMLTVFDKVQTRNAENPASLYSKDLQEIEKCIQVL